MLTVPWGIVPRYGSGRWPVRLAGASLVLVVGTGMMGGAAGSAATSPGGLTPGAIASIAGAGASGPAGPSGPGARPIPGSVLGDAWCQAGGGCMAAGYTQTRSTAYTLTERWDGAGWTVVPSPNPRGGTYSGFTDLTCVNSHDCFAGGHYYHPGSRTLIEHWNGAAWSITRSANPAGSPYNYIYGLGCAAASGCFAVGEASTNSLGYYPLTERWNGSAWSTVPAPEPAGSQGAILGGVACPAARDCLAVGINRTSRAIDHLTEQWNGTAWKILPGAPGVPAAGYLDGITCVSATSCDALGFTRTTADTALVLHWNGIGWSRVATPAPAGATDSYLYNASCLSASSCWAAGMYTIGAAHHTLLEHWNGTTWAIVPSPTPGHTSYSALTAAGCTGPASCVAVGFAETDGVNSVLTERWNGVKWSIEPAANVSR